MDIFDYIREQLLIEQEVIDEKMGIIKRIAAKDIFKTRAHAAAAKQLKAAKGEYKGVIAKSKKMLPGKKNKELRRSFNQSLFNPKGGESMLKKGIRPKDLKSKSKEVKSLRKQMIRRKLAAGAVAASGVGGTGYVGYRKVRKG